MNYIRLTPVTFPVYVYSMSSRNVSIDGAHSHIYAQIFGIAASPVTGLLGTQTLSQLSSCSKHILHPVTTRLLQSPHIYSPALLLNGPLWTIFITQNPPLSTVGPSWKSQSTFFFSAKTFFDVRRFPLESTQFREAKQLFIRAGSQVLRWFVYYVIQPVSRGKIDGRKIF